MTISQVPQAATKIDQTEHPKRYYHVKAGFTAAIHCEFDERDPFKDRHRTSLFDVSIVTYQPNQFLHPGSTYK